MSVFQDTSASEAGPRWGDRCLLVGLALPSLGSGRRLPEGCRPTRYAHCRREATSRASSPSRCWGFSKSKPRCLAGRGRLGRVVRKLQLPPVEVTYSHNAEADFAGSELARMFAADGSLCYEVSSAPGALSASASNEASSSPWPRADGVVVLLEGAGSSRRDIALEYKRPNEGVHGLLTAIGQAHAYIDKGYNGVAIVIPEAFPTLSDAGEYVTRVLDDVSQSKAIGVFTYEEPDTTLAAPFSGRIACRRTLRVVDSAAGQGLKRTSTSPRTQWVHMREGSTTRDAFFRFLQVAKRLSSGQITPLPPIPAELTAAITRLAPDKTAENYLANTADDRFLSQVWRAFWFEWIVTPEVLTPWISEEGTYKTPDAYTRIVRDDERAMSQIFEGRANGLKETLVALLNAGAVSEDEAWEMFACGIAPQAGRQAKQGIRDRAHSYREDLDSSLMHLGWLDNDGRPTDLGYRYTSLCERFGGPNSAAAKEYVGATLLQTGRYESFLHYLHRLSERRFAANPLAYTRESASGKPTFNEESYFEYLSDVETDMAEELKVMRKVSGRNRPRQRTPFQVELTLLRTYGFVSSKRHRLGVGVPIEWERVIEALNVEL